MGLEIVQGFEHEAEGLRQERVGAARAGFGEDIGLQHGHGPADGDHVIAQRLDFGGQELAEESQLVHDVADHGGEQFVAAEGEEFGIVGPKCGHGILGM